MIGCIWSCSTVQMLRFPVGTLIRFCHNHGLLQVRERPQWFTVTRRLARVRRQAGDAHRPGAAVDAGAGRRARPVARRRLRRRAWRARVRAHARGHRMVRRGRAGRARAAGARDAGRRQRRRAPRRWARSATSDNEAVLHTDERLLPRRRAAWAAWNYERDVAAGANGQNVCLHYLLNQLQPLPWTQPVIVSLNPLHEPRAGTVLRRIAYAHPVFDNAAIAAQGRLAGAAGPLARVVLRRVDGLRLPRGRPEVRPAGGRRDPGAPAPPRRRRRRAALREAA